MAKILSNSWKCNRMVVLYTQIALETAGSFTVPEHKTKILLFACQNMLHLSLSKVHSQHIHTVTTNINVYSSYK